MDFGIGQPVPRKEDSRFLIGRGRYLPDIVLDRMAFAAVVRAPHAHALIRRIDTLAAEAMPGVIAVFTGADFVADGRNPIPHAAQIAGPPDVALRLFPGVKLFTVGVSTIVHQRVRFVGEVVAIVIAESHNEARDAAEAVEVEYEPLPAVVRADEALKPGAPLVWSEAPANVSADGDVGDKAATDAAFARADKVVRHRFVINRITAATMEPRGAVGDFNAADGRYTLYTGLQRAHPIRSEVAKIIKVPESKLRVVAGDIGGSFGMKSPVFNEAVLTLLASKQIGRPVKWTSTRSEAFVGDPQGRDNVTDAELALDRDGNFVGFRVKTLAAAGAYLQAGMQACIFNAGTLAGVYRTPAMHADITAVFTNTNPVRPYRGNGRPEAAYVIERMVDLAADETGIDPAELRRRNCIPPDALPFKTGLTFTYDSGEFEKTMDMALALADYPDFEKRRAEAKRRGKLRGIGLSNTIERAAAASLEGAEIRFDRSGAVTLFSGSVSQGQGHETVFKQIVCDRLGLDPAEVLYLQGDTDQLFFGEGTGGSRSATLAGSAFLRASDKIIDKATRIAAHRLGVALDDVKFADGVFSAAGTNRTATIKEVAKDAANPARLPAGMEAGLIATAVYDAPVENFPNGCHVCEVEIDPDTGKVEIVRYSVVDDVGTVLNPLLLHGQIHGGIAQGAGQILLEDIRWDADGQLLTGSFMDYAMPRAGDLCAFATDSNPVPTATNPLGVKGAGEAGSVGAMPAVANAVIDALSAFGVRHIEMPATPERVWRAINGAGRHA
ncbi:MAG TPA: xanthine dehydrogenase family protein molybdopterin-binding subunit [Xanthobacteraceae bacterium]|nr:xanthine dehydrogenase family protein molybdopterin-binding subunit [Xanthobacteraceae bacterium]